MHEDMGKGEYENGSNEHNFLPCLVHSTTHFYFSWKFLLCQHPQLSSGSSADILLTCIHISPSYKQNVHRLFVLFHLLKYLKNSTKPNNKMHFSVVLLCIWCISTDERIFKLFFNSNGIIKSHMCELM